MPLSHIIGKKTLTTEIVRSTIDQALERLEECAVDLTEYTIVEALENSNSKVNKSCLRRTIRSAFRNPLSPIMQNYGGARDAFGTTLVSSHERERSVARKKSRKVTCKRSFSVGSK